VMTVIAGYSFFNAFSASRASRSADKAKITS
jgi:hypothetical protein